MNVVIWARVSSNEQKEGYSIDAQLRVTRERAAKSGWNVAREFAVAESAKRGAERLAFNQMFEWVRGNARKQKIETILSHKLDRVCRNMRDAVRLQELEDDCGVRLAFVENQFGPGAAGALSFNVMAAVAQYYSDNLRAEVHKGFDEKVRQGWPTGLAPFGYINTDDKDEPVQPDPVASEALKRIFGLYSTGRYTFDSLAERLAKEGFTCRPSQPRFSRTALSYIVNNRFYLGELRRNGVVYPGRYRRVIEPRLFDRCQDVANGRNRRTGNPSHTFSGGLFRCAHCGFAMTGETIRRKLLGGGVREHVYYKCAAVSPPKSHPKVRWREEELEEAILADLDRLRIPDAEAADWFRSALRKAFDNVDALQRQRKRTLTKRRTELAGMQDRLLNSHLAGLIDADVFRAKTEELKREITEVERSLDETGRHDPDAADRALAVFEYSQNLATGWRGLNPVEKRELLESVSSNRAVSRATIAVEKRKPFCFLEKSTDGQSGVGDSRSLKRDAVRVSSFLAVFFEPTPPHLAAPIRDGRAQKAHQAHPKAHPAQFEAHRAHRGAHSAHGRAHG